MFPQDKDNLHNSSQQQANLNDKLASIKQSYTDALPEKLDQIERLWNKLRFFNWSSEALKLLFSIVHTLAGNGKTFGFEKVSRYCSTIANQLQTYLVNGDIPNSEKQGEISQLIEQLVKTYKQPSSRIDTEPRTESVELSQSKELNRHIHSVYIVDDDKHIADLLSAKIEAAGYQVKTFYTVTDCLEEIKTSIPSTLVMDVMFQGQPDMQGILAAEYIKEIAGNYIPTIYISARHDITARLGALRAKGRGFLNKPINPELLIDKVDDLILSSKSIARIAIIDDDKHVSERNALILQKYNYETLVINVPLHALEKMQKFKPDLILMDIHMPDINGLELAQIIKQDENYLMTPILFLSADKSDAVKQASMTISGDEFLAKDITQKELLQKIHSRLVNVSIIKTKIQDISKKDNATDLVNRKYFFNLLEKTIAETNTNNSIYLIHISIDHFDIISKQVGLLHFDDFTKYILNIIKKSLNVSDVACHLTDQTIAVLCAEDLTTIQQISEKLIKTAASTPFIIDDIKTDFTLSVGLAEINQYSTNSEQVITQVEQAVSQAQAQGGNQVHKYAIKSIDDSSASIVSPELVSRIYQAVDEKRFKLVFQPVIGMGDSNDEHYEVLLRLVDSKDKLYLPGQFFPIIKQNNLVHEVDRWVVENTLAVYANNSKMKIRGNFFIKLTGESLSKGAFSIWVNNCINATGLLGKNRITFEIPEPDILTRNRDTRKFITHLPRPICKFAIDHFGSTEHSLKLLNELNIDYIKLDGALVNKILTDKEASNHVQSLVKAAQELKIGVIAGTLEEPKTLTMLWAWGVRYFQGYFIHSPNEELNYDFASHNQSIE